MSVRELQLVTPEEHTRLQQIEELLLDTANVLGCRPDQVRAEVMALKAELTKLKRELDWELAKT